MCLLWNHKSQNLILQNLHGLWVLWVNNLYVTVGEDYQNIPAINTLYLVGPDSILPNLVLELNPTIASAVTATFEDEPTAEAQPFEVAEHIIMVGKKQFDPVMLGQTCHANRHRG